MACIKTGAMVLFEDYGIAHVCDVHQIGDCIILKGTWKDHEGFHNFNRVVKRPITHKVKLGLGILDEARQFAAFHVSNLREA